MGIAYKEITRRLAEDTPFYARNVLKIVDKRRQMVALDANAGQLVLDAKLAAQAEASAPERAIALKARKVGVSTWMQGKMIQRATQRANYDVIVLAHDLKTGNELFRIGQRMYDNLPGDRAIKPDLGGTRRGREMHFLNGGVRNRGPAAFPDSTYLVDTATEKEAGRGLTPMGVHGCFVASTPILCADGEVKRADAVRRGDCVLTHNGVSAKVKRAWSKQWSEPMVEVVPWLSEPITLTRDHKVWVKGEQGEGWKRADDLTKGDLVSMPVREITADKQSLPTRPAERKGQTGGRRRKGGGSPVPLTEETGFAFGYYLAEGTVFFNKKIHPAGITFTRHREEKVFADRACEPLAEWISSRRTADRGGTLATAETIYCSALAEVVAAEFGCRGEKRVPDWVFTAGRNFCRGLLLGYLSGDGSKGYGAAGDPYDCPAVTATTVRSSIAFQMRDLAASLGYGWAKVTPKEGGNLHGRNCKPAWIVRWSGDAARGLRADLGLAASATTGRKWVQKYEIDGGKVWIKIRSVEEVRPSAEVWDIEVDHSDHSFRTAHFSISNSETAFWPDLGTKLAALENAVPDEPGSLIVLESTANGSNEFKDLWDDTVAGRNAYAAFFWPWWKEADYSRPFANDDERERFRPGDTHQFAHAADEPALLDPGPLDIDTNEHVPLTLEQLNWRRFKIGSKPLHVFNQEFPATPEDAFVASGRKVFDPAHVKRVFIATALTDPLNPTAEHPGPEVGKLIVKKKATRPMPNGDKLVVPTEAGWLPASKLKLGETADWRIYEQPKEGEQYVAGVDVSGGEIAGERGEPAYHAVEIIHHKTRVQVAEYRSRLDPDLLAEQVLLGALLYNEPWLAIEITGSWGAPIARKLWFAYHYKFMYFRQKHDRKVERSEDRLGWNTGRDTKPILEANTTELLREESHGIRSRGLAEELATYVRLPSGKSEPEPGKYADRLMAWQIAQQVALEKPVKRDFGSQPARPVRDRVTGW